MRGLGQQAGVTVKRPVSNTFHLAPIRFLNRPPGCSALLMVTQTYVLPLLSLITVWLHESRCDCIRLRATEQCEGKICGKTKLELDRDRTDGRSFPMPKTGFLAPLVCLLKIS